jgi:hypothetical protein
VSRIIEILTKAQDKIRDPKNWTQDTYARDETGASVKAHSPAAVCFCSLGAIESFFHSEEFDGLEVMHARDFLYTAANQIADGRTVANYNDDPDRTHDEIMALWDRAKEIAHATGS